MRKFYSILYSSFATLEKKFKQNVHKFLETRMVNFTIVDFFKKKIDQAHLNIFSRSQELLFHMRSKFAII